MIAETLKSTNLTFWANLQYVGLIAAKVPSFNLKTVTGGKHTEQIGGTPLTGQIELLVHQGGLRERSIPANVKELFRREVMPVLAETIPHISQKYIGNITLHFNEGILTNLNLTP